MNNKLQNFLLVSANILLIILVIITSTLLLKLYEKGDEGGKGNSPFLDNKQPTNTFPSPTQIPLPSMHIVASSSALPSRIMDLTNWKLTLPTGDFEKPTEIKQPQLDKFGADPWFIINQNRNGVRFRSSVNGATTTGSDYPRSELREMTDNGKSNASWSSSSGAHTMFIEEAITAVPLKKKHVVAGQIHDDSDDIIVIRLEDQELMINVDGDNKYTLDSNYVLGRRFTVKFIVRNGKTEVYYNRSAIPVYTLDKDYSGAYFKAGAYTQSNCSKEDPSDCNDANYGEVVIYQLIVSHK